MSWPKEVIPDEDRLFMRVHRNLLSKEGELRPGVFRDHGGGMSTDWSKYSTPEETIARAKTPADNGAIVLPVGGVRTIPTLRVEHAPVAENRAHADVIGEKTPEVRVLLLRLVEWASRPRRSATDE